MLAFFLAKMIVATQGDSCPGFRDRWPPPTLKRQSGLFFRLVPEEPNLSVTKEGLIWCCNSSQRDCPHSDCHLILKKWLTTAVCGECPKNMLSIHFLD